MVIPILIGEKGVGSYTDGSVAQWHNRPRAGRKTIFATVADVALTPIPVNAVNHRRRRRWPCELDLPGNIASAGGSTG